MSESEGKYEVHRVTSPHDVTVESNHDTEAEAVAEAQRQAEGDETHAYEAVRFIDEEHSEVVWSSRRV